MAAEATKAGVTELGLEVAQLAAVLAREEATMVEETGVAATEGVMEAVLVVAMAPAGWAAVAVEAVAVVARAAVPRAEG